jgi:hypothetical protein
MLVSGEDSITRAGSLEAAGLEVELAGAAVELDVAPVGEVGGVVEVELDEQAARPAARRPVAVSASALLLVILLIFNLTFPSEGNAIERRAFP